MAGYLPAAAAEQAAQYAALGLSGPEALYRDVPESVRLTASLASMAMDSGRPSSSMVE